MKQVLRAADVTPIEYDARFRRACRRWYVRSTLCAVGRLSLKLKAWLALVRKRRCRSEHADAMCRRAQAIGRMSLRLKAWLKGVRKERRVREQKALADAPRRCRECQNSLPREAYTATQWKKPQRTCQDCQAALAEAAAALKVAASAEAAAEAAAAAAAEAAAAEAAAAAAAPRAWNCGVCWEDCEANERTHMKCAHWMCLGCASHMLRLNTLHECPFCRDKIHNPHMLLPAR